MKKIILSLAAIFTVSIASAQSYSKQPDPKVYNVVRYKKKAAVEQETTTENKEVTAEAKREEEINNESLVNTEGELNTKPSNRLAKNEDQ